MVFVATWDGKEQIELRAPPIYKCREHGLQRPSVDAAEPDSRRRLQSEWNQELYKHKSSKSVMRQNGMSHSTVLGGMGGIR